ncbi:hypothetical protein GSUB_16780 (plasmid) [Geoalkalibacter subterraneus]|uniref:Uncharacterized protein n=2 Tax=Geoalkalibacter subterraneus TaxID=483547 RepID=A0A0B5FX30_9BACT|nr:hypothetical protein GSUB_16780 [Geoalkalibacter subterraneus]
MLEYHFQRVAAEKGYGDSKACFSLGFCQGDHVSFDGENPDLELLAERLLGGKQLEAAKQAIDKDMDVSIRDGRAYDNDLGQDLTSAEEHAAKELFFAIEEDLKNLQRELLRQGHDLILNGPGYEGEVLYERSTERFTLKVILFDEQEYDSWDASGEEDYDWAGIFDIIYGHMKFGYVRVVVENEDGEELGTSLIGNVWADAKNPWKSVRVGLRDTIEEAISEARKTVGMVKDELSEESA